MMLISRYRCVALRGQWRILLYNLVHFGASRFEVPIVFLADEDQPAAGATLATQVVTVAVPIVKTESISAPTQGARPMLIREIVSFNTETRQDLAPTMSRAFDCLAGHHATRCDWDLAQAIWRDRIQDSVAIDGPCGLSEFQFHGGNDPCRSLNLCAAQPCLCPRPIA